MPDIKRPRLLLSLLLLMGQAWDCTPCSWQLRSLSDIGTNARQAAETIRPVSSVLRRLTLERELPERLQNSISSFNLYSSHEFEGHNGIGILAAADQVGYISKSEKITKHAYQQIRVFSKGRSATVGKISLKASRMSLSTTGGSPIDGSSTAVTG